MLERAADRQKTLVLQERSEADAATHLRLRGAYDSVGELVQAHVPSWLHAWPAGAATDALVLIPAESTAILL